MKNKYFITCKVKTSSKWKKQTYTLVSRLDIASLCKIITDRENYILVDVQKVV